MLVPQHIPRADLHVETHGPPLYPGSTLEIHVSLLPLEDFRISEATIELVQQEMSALDGYRPIMRTSISAFGRIYSHVASTASPRKSYRQSFFTDTEVSSGVRYDNQLSIALPQDAPPTVKSNTARIFWQLRASVTVDRSHPSHANGIAIPGLGLARIDSEPIEVVVFWPAGEAPDPSSQTDPSDASESVFNQCTLLLESGPQWVRNGGIIGGVLRAEFRRSLPLQQARIELIRWERSGAKQTESVAARTVLAGPRHLLAGALHEWPFELRVPDQLVPSIATDTTFVAWHLKATLARRMRPDFHVRQMVRVYTGP